MIYYIKEATEGQVVDFFDNLEVDGIGLDIADDEIVWHRYRHKYEKDYLTFVAQEAGTFKFSGSTSSNTLQYSLNDGETWTALAHDTNSPTVAAGGKILWKASGLTINPSNGVGKFVSSNRFEAEGNVMSLLYGDDFKGQTSLEGKVWAFACLFRASTGITTAENLILPATTLVYACYDGMFRGCTTLTTAPELPATVLDEYCYEGMFSGCTSLITPPELPATTLTRSCYMAMFVGCSSLTTAPELPATTLATYCYGNMFKGCTSLRIAPELPATTLDTYCYCYMFRDCTSLTIAPELPATALTNTCYQYMFAGCTGLATAPELPATTLAGSCYRNMFRGCTSLTTAPELPATTLANYCYEYMFSGCTSLNYIKCLTSSGMTATQCLSNWVSGVASTGTFVKSPSATTGSTDGDSQWLINSPNGIPEGWTVQDA